MGVRIFNSLRLTVREALQMLFYSGVISNQSILGDKNVFNVFNGRLQTKTGHVHTRKDDDGDHCGSHDCRCYLLFEVGS